MPSCLKCEGFTDSRTFASPDAYRDFVQELIDLIDKKRLSLVRADFPLQEMVVPPWPGGDTIAHELQCRGCGRIFELCVNVWNGRNWWESKEWPQEAETSNPFVIQ
jgi:hypothetical protein